MNKTALYARVSTDQQATGLESQVRILRDYCTKNDIVNYELFADEGISGTKASRPALDRMIAAVNNGEISSVIVYSFSRFARSTTHLLNALQIFKSKNVAFVSLTEKIDDVNPIIRREDFVNIYRGLTCVPDAALDRDARSRKMPVEGNGRARYLTTLNWVNWANKPGKLTRIDLVAHELAVMADYELDDGDYTHGSQDIAPILFKNSLEFRLDLASSNWVKNPDGSYFIQDPRYFDINTQKSILLSNTDNNSNKVCRYLGFTESNASTWMTYGGTPRDYAVLFSSGGIQEIYNTSKNKNVYESIVCRTP